MQTSQKQYILIIILLISFTGLKAQLTDTDVKLAYIYRFTNYIEWQHQDKQTPFTIGVFSDDKIMLKKFKYLSKSRKIQGRKIVIVPIPNLKMLKKTKLNILYIDNGRNFNILNIFTSVKGKNTLLVSDNCPIKEAVMINFLPSKKEEHVRFEINKKNSTNEGLIIKSDILLLGGTYIDIRELFHEKELELKHEKEKFKQSKLELQKQKELIEKQDKDIAEREEILLLKNSKIRAQELKLSSDKLILDSFSVEIEEKQVLLNNKLVVLDKQESQILEQQKSMLESKAELLKQKEKLGIQRKSLAIQKELINQQESLVDKQLSRISFQQYILYTFIFILLLAIGLIYFIYKGFKDKKRANIKLRTFNDEILAQNEEIRAQREEIRATNDSLANANTELEKLSVVASTTNNAVIIADADGKIEWVNKGFTKLFGYQLDELILKFGKNLAKANKLVDIDDKIAECKNTKQTVEYLVQNTTKSGKKLWMHTSLTPILDDAGNVKKLIAIEANVTELKIAEENIQLQKEEILEQYDKIEAQNAVVEQKNSELEKYKINLENLVEERTEQLLLAKEKAEESDRLKSAFIANMSHEIRTPMNAIVGFSSLLTQPGLTEEKTEDFVNIINANANSLIQLIDDIIDLSKIEAGKLVVKKTSCNINSVLEELYVTFDEKIRAEKRAIKLIFNKKQIKEKLIVQTDKIRMKQVLVNLLNNAMKFTEKGTVEFGYTIVEKRRGVSLQLYVKDTGIGIEKNKCKVIFERFMKIEEDKMKLYRGTGLGLSISKAIVTDLGGNIWVESETGKGSIFYFTIPIGKG